MGQCYQVLKFNLKKLLCFQAKKIKLTECPKCLTFYTQVKLFNGRPQIIKKKKKKNIFCYLISSPWTSERILKSFKRKREGNE